MSEQKFSKISAARILSLIKEIKSEVFLKLSSGRMIKILSPGVDETKDTIKKYREKGVAYFYIPHEIFLESQSIIERDLEKHLNNDTDDLGLSTESTLALIEDVKDLVVNLGLNKVTANQLKESIVHIEKEYSKMPNMEALFELLSSRDGYIKEHGYLTGYVASALANELDWGSSGLVDKLITASLFQNISLDNNEMAKVFTLSGDIYDNCDSYEKEGISRHPFLSADLVDYEDILSDKVTKLIHCHHEQPDGSGFPGRIQASSITPLEASFILSVNFAHELIMAGSFDKAQYIILQLGEKYKSGNYLKVYEGFMKVFTKLT